MSDLDDFVKNNAPSGKKSKLDDFAEEIFTLKKLGYSEKDIVRFLLEKKAVSVTQPTLNRFIRSRKSACSVFKQPENIAFSSNQTVLNDQGQQGKNEERIPVFEFKPGEFDVNKFVG